MSPRRFFTIVGRNTMVCCVDVTVVVDFSEWGQEQAQEVKQKLSQKFVCFLTCAISILHKKMEETLHFFLF